MNLTGKIALVTGAAHRVGRAIALALARQGAHIVIHYGRADEAARQTEADIKKLGSQALTWSANLAEPDQVEGLFDAVRTHFGRLDVLVNSAASFQKQSFDAITLEDWDRVMAINLRAPFLCSQQAARLMRETDRTDPAVIANIVDLSGVFPWPGYVQHGVSKAGLLHLTRIAARELAPEIRVNALLLGPIMPTQERGANAKWQHLIESLPLERQGGGESVGHAIVFLAQNDFITGAAIELDGGESLIGPVNY